MVGPLLVQDGGPVEAGGLCFSCSASQAEMQCFSMPIWTQKKQIDVSLWQQQMLVTAYRRALCSFSRRTGYLSADDHMLQATQPAGYA
jgi:hypothetical protein